MKLNILLFIYITLAISCSKDDETKKLTSFMESFSVNLKSYKVVCFVPADGCFDCIDPTLTYSKKGNNSYLMVLSSLYTKSIDGIIEFKNIDRSKIVIDDTNLAASLGLVPFTAPSYYFLKKGHIIKSIDATGAADKNSIIEEVDKFLLK